MATEALNTYQVVTPVSGDKRYAPGSPIELTDSDAAPLLDLGVIKIPDSAFADSVAAQASPVVLGASTIAKLTIAELNAYANAHSLLVDAAWSKDELVAALTAATAQK